MGIPSPEDTIALFKASEQVRKRAQEAAARGGTQKVEEELDQIIEKLKKNQEEEPAYLAMVFLETATRKLWDDSQSLEPVMHLFEKYYPVEITEEGHFPGFTSVVGKIAAELKGTDRTNTIDSAVAFLTRHNSSIPSRVQELSFFARELYENGAKNEARQMATLLRASAESVLNEMPLANSYIREIIEGSK